MNIPLRTKSSPKKVEKPRQRIESESESASDFNFQNESFIQTTEPTSPQQHDLSPLTKPKNTSKTTTNDYDLDLIPRQQNLKPYEPKQPLSTDYVQTEP